MGISTLLQSMLLLSLALLLGALGPLPAAAKSSGSNPPSLECNAPQDIINSVSSTGAIALGCILDKSAPTRYCRMCKGYMNDYQVAFNNLSSDCQSFGALRRTHRFLAAQSGDATSTPRGLWYLSYCDKCSLDDFDFMVEYECRVLTCLSNVTDCPFRNEDPFDWSVYALIAASPNASAMCGQCQEAFNALLAMHDGLSEDCARSADVSDQFRRVLEIWDMFHCKLHSASYGTLIVTFAVAILAPLVFYLGSFLYARRKVHTALLQAPQASVQDDEQAPLLETRSRSSSVNLPVMDGDNMRRWASMTDVTSVGSPVDNYLVPRALVVGDSQEGTLLLSHASHYDPEGHPLSSHPTSGRHSPTGPAQNNDLF